MISLGSLLISVFEEIEEDNLDYAKLKLQHLPLST